MPVLIAKNAFSPREPSDGWRCLVMRYWPRGVSKGEVDFNWPDLAPSPELIEAYLRGGLPWRAFAARYRAEMKGQRSFLRLLRHLEKSGQRLTLLCACPDPAKCHRGLLAGLIQPSQPKRLLRRRRQRASRRRERPPLSAGGGSRMKWRGPRGRSASPPNGGGTAPSPPATIGASRTNMAAASGSTAFPAAPAPAGTCMACWLD